MTLVQEVWSAARLDLAEIRRSRWLVFCVALYGVIASLFVLVGLRESNVLGFTGMGRVLFSLCHALVLVLPLLALTATVLVVNRARDDGTLELLFSLPLRRTTYFAAVTLARYLALLAPLVLTLVALSIVGLALMGQAVPWAFLARTLVVCAALLAAFTGLGFLISTLVRNQSRAVVYALLAWALGVAMLDFGLIALMLQWRLQPLTVLLLGALNPVQAARLALVSGASPELSVLGPVGAFLSHHVGGAALFGLGTLWPALVGLACWAWAARSFGRGDLV